MISVKLLNITTYGVDATSFPDDDIDFDGFGQGSIPAGNGWGFLYAFIIN